jgi:hypothetical protein
MEQQELTDVQKLFYHWIVEREKCRVGRENNLPKPWSTDPILQSYRFCNVRREDDKVTKWIKDHWRAPYNGNEHMVLAMVMARTINWPETLDDIGFPLFSKFLFAQWLSEVRVKMKSRRERGLKVWTGAYLVSTNGNSMDKIDYILDRVWTPIYLKMQVPAALETLEEFHKRLMKFDGMGSFMAAQVVADLKHTCVLNHCVDWHSWSAIGPGSRRGLNRYFARKLEGTIATPQYHREIAMLQYAVQQNCGLNLAAQDIQNCLCEYDKYVRVYNGEGKPRSMYNGK